MRVRMLTTSAGPSGVVDVGAEIVVSNAEGKDLIDGGYSVLVNTPKKSEAPSDETDEKSTSDASDKAPEGGKKPTAKGK